MRITLREFFFMMYIQYVILKPAVRRERNCCPRKSTGLAPARPSPGVPSHGERFNPARTESLRAASTGTFDWSSHSREGPPRPHDSPDRRA